MGVKERPLRWIFPIAVGGTGAALAGEDRPPESKARIRTSVGARDKTNLLHKLAQSQDRRTADPRNDRSDELFRHVAQTRQLGRHAPDPTCRRSANSNLRLIDSFRAMERI